MYIIINTKWNIVNLPSIVRLEINWKTIFMPSEARLKFFLKNNHKLYTRASKSRSPGWIFSSHKVFPGCMSFFHDIYLILQNSTIFPGFPGALSFFQVFQVEWEPWIVGTLRDLRWPLDRQSGTSSLAGAQAGESGSTKATAGDTEPLKPQSYYG